MASALMFRLRIRTMFEQVTVGDFEDVVIGFAVFAVGAVLFVAVGAVEVVASMASRINVLATPDTNCIVTALQS